MKIPWFCVSSRYSEHALIIALLVILNRVALSFNIFTLDWMSDRSGAGATDFLSPEPEVAVSRSVTDRWSACPCLTIRSLQVRRSSSFVDMDLK